MAPPVPAAVARPAAGVAVLLAAAIAAAALPVAPSVVSDLFLGTPVPSAAVTDAAVAAVLGDVVARQAAAPSPTPAIWDDYGGGPPPGAAGAVVGLPAGVLTPTEEAPPDSTDGGSDGGSDGGGPDGSDAPGVSDEPIWDDYGGGSPYPPIPDGTEDDGPPDGGELQDPPADAATPDGDGCGDLGSVCHRLVRCCGEAAGTTVCAAAADSGDEHPTTGHCMRTVVG